MISPPTYVYTIQYASFIGWLHEKIKINRKSVFVVQYNLEAETGG